MDLFVADAPKIGVEDSLHQRAEYYATIKREIHV